MKSMRKRSASVAIAEHSGAPNVPICVRPEYRFPAGMGPRIGSRDRGTNIRAASARKISVHRCSPAGCCKPVRAPSESLPLRHSARPDRRALRPHGLPRCGRNRRRCGESVSFQSGIRACVRKQRSRSIGMPRRGRASSAPAVRAAAPGENGPVYAADAGAGPLGVSKLLTAL